MTTAPIRTFLLIICMLSIVSNNQADDKPPRAIDDRLKIELFAEHPDIVTPTGIDVDHKGRVWAIESNTHFPPAGYQGHPSDRILVMQDSNGDHKADKITVFTDGLKHTMSIAVKPVWLSSQESRAQRREQKDKASGRRKPADNPNQPPTQDRDKHPNKSARDSRLSTLDVFIATRRAIWLYTDTNGDLKADKKQRIIQLDTKGDYPHNGLAGFAFDAMGWMYFGFGENLGADYKIIGSDGTTLKGGGEGGNLYRCRPDGSKLKQWATGFWNPHASCVDAFGRLFTVDNDPDSRPPCRLLHIIEGGDYGFRFRNGRKGLHPFTAWNGEIPGTLPMVSGTGEAPSGIVAYESDGFPKDYIGNLLVGSWGDHRIDRFRLKPLGASFESLPETIIQGGEDFRPVGLAVAPDGSLYLTDWVKRDYKLHGHGRVWRVSLKDEANVKMTDANKLVASRSPNDLVKLLESPRLEIRRKAAQLLQSTPGGRKQLATWLGSTSDRAAIESLWALMRVPIKVANMGMNLLIGKTSANEIRSKRVRSTYFELLASDVPQSLNLSETGQMLALLSGYSLADTELRKKLIDGQTRDAEMAFLMSTVRVAAPWMPPHLLFDLENDNDESGKSEDFALARIVQNADAYLFAAYVDAMSRSPDNVPENTARHVARIGYPRARLGYLLSAKRRNPQEQAPLRWGLSDSDAQVRRAAVQWIAEENLTGFRPQVEAILNSETMTTDLFLATLAALEMLDGKDPKDFDKTPAGKYVLPLVKDEKRSPAVRAQALRLVDENDPALDAKLMRSLLEQNNAALQLEAVRSLQHSTAPFVGELLAAVAVDEQRPLATRAEAVVGLAGRSYFPKRNAAVVEALEQLRKADEPRLQLEAIRSMRKDLTKTAKGRGIRLALLRRFDEARKRNQQALDKGGSHRAQAEQLALVLSQAQIEIPEVLQSVQSERPTTPAEWSAQLEKSKGDPAAGRRTFFHSHGAGCYRCHTINGRGEQIGPDLSHIGGAFNRKRLIESILEPSKEIAPQFISWTFLMESGKVHVGMLLGDTRDNKQRIGTPTGEVIELQAREIEERHPQQKSLMPDDLHKQLTVSEFRDLLAYLESLK